jgi:hypothetical protein
LEVIRIENEGMDGYANKEADGLSVCRVRHRNMGDFGPTCIRLKLEHHFMDGN